MVGIDIGSGFTTFSERQERQRLKALQQGKQDAWESRFYDELLIITLGAVLMLMTLLVAGALVVYYEFNMFSLVAEAFSNWRRSRGG